MDYSTILTMSYFVFSIFSAGFISGFIIGRNLSDKKMKEDIREQGNLIKKASSRVVFLEKLNNKQESHG